LDRSDPAAVRDKVTSVLDAFDIAAAESLSNSVVLMDHATKEERYNARLSWLVQKTQQIVLEIRKDILKLPKNEPMGIALLMNLAALNAATTAISNAMAEDQKETNGKSV
jgi:hypothetical protein